MKKLLIEVLVELQEIKKLLQVIVSNKEQIGEISSPYTSSSELVARGKQLLARRADSRL